ncbi:GNAT family N-acetyltransferase [Oceanobacillus chungangensis]|uniref:GNAT family N-acetyltransferase n=1 Tax=Oceanobacillus chungangensis TaxID=1229152 RepID=A0A3D8PXA5_9BACI|nr:GNAT family N-acetyltransferase [Oceanobacillus chungangensis]RDW19908.1 GNAT family N-acetyltransferase [Oceanobacillus chungangensis]
MLTLVKNEIDKISLEKEIMNSNTEYNLIAYGKEILENEDILEIFKESELLQVERYFVKKDNEFIGIIDFGMSSPRHNQPWISLLAVHKKYQNLGYATEIFKFYERLMRNKQVKFIQIAVHSTNRRALHFWTSLGFTKFDERTYEGQVFFSLEKEVG